jgi:hypothetical protein
VVRPLLQDRFGEFFDEERHSIGMHQDAVDHGYRQNPVTNDFPNEGLCLSPIEYG